MLYLQSQPELEFEHGRETTLITILLAHEGCRTIEFDTGQYLMRILMRYACYFYGMSRLLLKCVLNPVEQQVGVPFPDSTEANSSSPERKKASMTWE